LLAASSGARRRILHGYPVGYWRALHFIGERVPAQRGLHDVVQNLGLLLALGVEADLGEGPVFAVTAEDRARASELLRRAGWAGGGGWGGGGWSGRRFMLDRIRGWRILRRRWGRRR